MLAISTSPMVSGNHSTHHTHSPRTHPLTTALVEHVCHDLFEPANAPVLVAALRRLWRPPRGVAVVVDDGDVCGGIVDRESSSDCETSKIKPPQVVLGSISMTMRRSIVTRRRFAAVMAMSE